MVLEAPGDVHCFRFCPTNPDLIIGGLESGQIAMWSLADARASAREAKLLNDDATDEGEYEEDYDWYGCPVQEEGEEAQEAIEVYQGSQATRRRERRRTTGVGCGADL